MALFSAGLRLITVGLSAVTPIPSHTLHPNFVAPWGLGVAGLAVFLKPPTSSERLLSSILPYFVGTYLKFMLVLLPVCSG